MNHEVERYPGELRELRALVAQRNDVDVYDDLSGSECIDEALNLLGKAFAKMEAGGASYKDLRQLAYDISAAINTFAFQDLSEKNIADGR
jgi:hypothetical protein